RYYYIVCDDVDMRTTTLIDDALSLTMGTTGILFELSSTVEIDFQIDRLDDVRRDKYIDTSLSAIERLKKFADQFGDKTFSNWVNRYSDFLKADLEKQLYYEKLSDELRDKLYNNILEKKEKLRTENQNFEKMLFEKSYKK
ncbi:MAG: hypothetical protein ACRC6A_12420, partial [Fusobacteriaceae bacterium]